VENFIYNAIVPIICAIIGILSLSCYYFFSKKTLTMKQHNKNTINSKQIGIYNEGVINEYTNKDESRK
jgi:hypothetical protein